LFLFYFIFCITASSDSKDFYEKNRQLTKECSTEFTTYDKFVGGPGDLIEFQRANGLYGHWVDHVGDNYVIHWNGVNISKDKVETIAKNGVCRVNNREITAQRRNLELKPKHQILAFAYKSLNQFKNKCFKYSVTDFNCEHFATLCAFGQAFSEQADNVKDKAVFRYFSHFFDLTIGMKASNAAKDEN
jgi:hypothetical protein